MIWRAGPYDGSAEADTDIGTYKVIQINDTFRVIVNGVVICRDACNINAAKESAERHYASRP